ADCRDEVPLHLPIASEGIDENFGGPRSTDDLAKALLATEAAEMNQRDPSNVIGAAGRFQGVGWGRSKPMLELCIRHRQNVNTRPPRAETEFDVFQSEFPKCAEASQALKRRLCQGQATARRNRQQARNLGF